MVFRGTFFWASYRRFNLERHSLQKCHEVVKRSGLYPEVHKHRIAEVNALAALYVLKGE
jgi:hypothetical protein